MPSDQPRSAVATGVLIGATVVSFIIVMVVLAVVSIIIGGLVTLFSYYVSSMRIEAAGFFGALFGGWWGVVASRMSCDAILKNYSKKSVFVFLVALALVGLYIEFFTLPFNWDRLTPVSQLTIITVSGYIYFWSGADVDV